MIGYVNFCIYVNTLKIFSLTHFKNAKKNEALIKYGGHILGGT